MASQYDNLTKEQLISELDKNRQIKNEVRGMIRAVAVSIECGDHIEMQKILFQCEELLRS